MAETKHGYLLLADITGYTSYLAKSELDHANEILSDLLEIIINQFKPVLNIAKLEGDAVFANIEESKVTRPESLLELIESTYIAFRRRRDSSLRSTTCQCNACHNMGTLELKFFLHHGDYIEQKISGIPELVGSDVNLVHRLMKNSITEKTGWSAYVLFTKVGVQTTALPEEELYRSEETYDHLGTVETYTLNLLPRYETLINSQRVTIEAQDADMIIPFHLNAPVNVVWDWLTDIKNRNKTMGEQNVTWTMGARDKGNRTGPGSNNHCAHGKGVSQETILDWRPFEYTTVENVDGSFIFREMMIFQPSSNGLTTNLEVRLKLYNPQPLFLTRLMAKLQFYRSNPYLLWFSVVERLINS